MIENRYPATGISYALRWKGKYEYRSDQIYSFANFPNWVIGWLTENQKKCGTEGIQYLQGRVGKEWFLAEIVRGAKIATASILSK